jgi:MFS family permease
MGAHPLLQRIQPLQQRIFGQFPFARLAHTHALSTSADAFFAVSLAGSLFFNVSVDAARPRIILFLLLTMAPFAIVAPIMGPLIDRFARARTGVISLTILARGILCLFIAGDLRNLLFYPEAFAVLVLGKGYSVAKSAAVPGLVDDAGRLVAANSRLSRISSITGVAAGGIAAGILALGGAPLVLRVGSLVYFAGAALALRIPPVSEIPTAAPDVEHFEVHSSSVLLGASVLSVLRASIGFLIFLIAFELRRGSEPLWLYGALAVAVGIGNFAATVISPAVKRRWLREEQLFAAALILATVAAFVCAWQFSRPMVLTAALVIGLAQNVGRQAFDSVLQRDAPDATRGKHFARFETRFQLAWVIGALIPVAVALGARTGLIVLGVSFAAALAAYLAGVSIESRVAAFCRNAWRWRGRPPAGGSDGS